MTEARALPEDSLSSISSYLWEEFELDAEDISDMIDEFLKNLGDLGKESSELLAAGNFQGLRRNGHSIKGLSANIGAACVSALGKALEERALAGDIKGCEELLASMSRKYEALKAAKDEKS